MYIARMASGAVLILLVISQAIFSLTMIGNASSIRDSFMAKAFGAMGTIDGEFGTRLSEADFDNYQRMDLGLCMFCSPESCEERFSKYETENALFTSATTTETEGSSGTGTITEEATASETSNETPVESSKTEASGSGRLLDAHGESVTSTKPIDSNPSSSVDSTSSSEPASTVGTATSTETSNEVSGTSETSPADENTTATI